MVDNIEVAKLQILIATANDQAAYVRLYRIYFTPLHQFANAIVNSKQIAEEIISDVFLQLWQNRQQLPAIRNLTVYLYTCTRNQALNIVSKEKRNLTSTLDDGCLYIASCNPNPEELMMNAELKEKITGAIQQLPDKCRTIFKMVREDGMKYREVAEVLNISIKTVEAQIGIAMKKMNHALQSSNSEDMQHATPITFSPGK